MGEVGMDELAGPATERDIGSVRITIEYQFASKAVRAVQGIRFKDGTPPDAVASAVGEKAAAMTGECMAYIAVALGARRAGS